MATYYVDTAGSNTAPYNTWAKAATSLQTVADIADEGDITFCRGTQTLTAPIDFNANSGVLKYIRFIGCNAGGTVDGTKFVLDANDAATNCVLGGVNIGGVWLHNFTFKRATGDGVDGGNGSDNWIFINCDFEDNDTHGFDGATMDWPLFIKCRFFNNTSDGAYSPYYSARFLFCSFYGNGDDGIACGTYSFGVSIVGCVFHDNGDNGDGIEDIRHDGLIMNCVFEGTDQTGESGIDLQGIGTFVIGNRFANLAVGLDAGTSAGIYGWNYFHNNTDDTSNDGSLLALYDGSVLTNKFDVDADDGFNDVANDDFNIKANRTLRRTEIDLGIGS